jgi:hypothetical protein
MNKKKKTSSKPCKKKKKLKRRVEGVAQVVTCLHSKCEALSSNSSTTKKQRQLKEN